MPVQSLTVNSILYSLPSNRFNGLRCMYLLRPRTSNLPMGILSYNSMPENFNYWQITKLSGICDWLK